MNNSDAAKPGGKRGRPELSMNKFSREAREKAQATGMLPHEFMLAVMRGERITRTVPLDPTQPDGKTTTVVEAYGFDERLDAAKAAAPYYAPKISTVEVIQGIPDDELNRIIAQLASEAGVDTGALGGGEEEQEEAAPRVRRKCAE